MRTMPVGFPFLRTFLEDLATAFGTDDVVAEAKVLVEN
jgi:hypothetical protein